VVLPPPVIDRETPSPRRASAARVLPTHSITLGDRMTAQPTYAPSPFGAAPVRPTPSRPASPRRRRRTGRLSVVAAVLVVLAGLAAVAQHYFFATKTVQPASVQDEVVRVTQAAVQVAPTGVRCPEGIAAQAGATFTCTGAVDGQPVTWWVHQDDDRGGLTVTFDRLLRLDALEQSVATKVSADLRTTVTVDCGPADRTVLRNTPGQDIDCTATRTAAPQTGTTRPGARKTAEPTQTRPMTVTVDEDGVAAYRLR
jgi:Domain of unknown function (DUF4333)